MSAIALIIDKCVVEMDDLELLNFDHDNSLHSQGAIKMIFRLMVRFGNWMITEKGIFELRRHQAVKSPTTSWQQWDLIKEW